MISKVRLKTEPKSHSRKFGHPLSLTMCDRLSFRTRVFAKRFSNKSDHVRWPLLVHPVVRVGFFGRLRLILASHATMHIAWFDLMYGWAQFFGAGYSIWSHLWEVDHRLALLYLLRVRFSVELLPWCVQACSSVSNCFAPAQRRIASTKKKCRIIPHFQSVKWFWISILFYMHWKLMQWHTNWCLKIDYVDLRWMHVWCTERTAHMTRRRAGGQEGEDGQ